MVLTQIGFDLPGQFGHAVTIHKREDGGLERREAWMESQAKRVVCIEDEPEMIDLVRLILGRKGFEVIGANGGVEGLEAVRREKPDLVLLDLMMPDMDGWEVYRRLKEDPLLAPVPVMVVTARAQDIDRVLGRHDTRSNPGCVRRFLGGC